MKTNITTLYLILTVIFIFIFTPLSAKAFTPVSDNRLTLLLENIEKNFSQIKTLKTMVVQEKNIALFSETVTSTGFCIFKSPDKLRLEFMTPFKSALIVNTNQIFKYEFMNGTWKKLNAGNEEILFLIMENISSWLQGRFKDPLLYDISAFVDKNTTILLTPKANAFKKFISSFELGLNHELNALEYIIINESKNNFTKILFHNDVINSDIPDIFFDGTRNMPYPVEKW